jgi:glycosyltransferase involved in cell wall biosynthesis
MQSPIQPRVGFLTSADPRDRRSWSGILTSMLEALERQGLEMLVLGPADVPSRLWLRLVHRILEKLTQFTGSRYNRHHSVLTSLARARFFHRRLRAAPPLDVIFAPDASSEIAFLPCSAPIVYLSDTTFALMIGYYAQFTNLSKLSLAEGHVIERRAIQRSAATIFSSHWAATSAIQHYHAPRERLHVVPFGANVESRTLPALDELSTTGDTCHLLFLGVEWTRKGGPIAFQTLLALLDAGVSADLTVCGCVPSPAYRHDLLTVIPFLDKNVPADGARYDRLLGASDFLLLPTRADCSPVVIGEANAYGIPVIASITGGVPEAVTPGVNGFLLPYTAAAEEYAAAIQSLWIDKEAYRCLARTSRERYDTTLNWDAWAQHTAQIIRSVACHPTRA